MKLYTPKDVPYACFGALSATTAIVRYVKSLFEERDDLKWK
jgi:hypothetical protein